MTRLTTILLSAASLVACTDDGNDGGTVIPSTAQWRAAIAGTGSFASIRGTSDVVLARDGGSFTAVTEISGGTPGSVYPWHVHFGTCAATGAIIGATVYPELAVGNDGSAFADVTVGAPLDVATAYSVNLHISPDNLPTIIACGDLVLEGGGGGGGGGGDDDDGRY